MRRRAAAAGPRRFTPLTSGAGLLAAATAVALALTLAGLVAALISLRPPPLLSTGVYYGWTDGRAGLFQVLGAPCPEALGTRDAVVAASLGRGSTVTHFRPPAVAATAEPFVFAQAVPVLSFAAGAMATFASTGRSQQARSPDGPDEALLSRLTVTCRSHAAATARLGSAAVALLPASAPLGDPSGDRPPASGLAVTSRLLPPASDLLGVLVVSNDGDETLVLHSLRYAPRGSTTGTVVAAAGDRSKVAGWLGAVLRAPAGRPLAGTVEPASLTPWDAAFQAPYDPGALRTRNADDLDLLLQPGDMALIALDQRALARTVVSRPVLLYPVLAYASGPAPADTHQLTWSGLATPLYGSTAAWR